VVEITDADALREAALKKFDAADSTSDDYPDTADWHASEEGQEERRQVATQDKDALNMFVDPFKACELFDGVPGVKAVTRGSGRCGPWRTQNRDRPGRGANDATERLQGAEVQSRGRNASCRRPFTQCEGRVPEAEGPGQDRDEVLDPAMKRRQSGSSRRNMGGCCVVEDTDQNVDGDEQPSCAKKGVQEFHLSSPPAWTLELLQMSDRFAGSRRKMRKSREDYASCRYPLTH
jgi:hypothetical protein